MRGADSSSSGQVPFDLVIARLEKDGYIPKRKGKELPKPYRRALEDIKKEAGILASADPIEIPSMSFIPRADVVALMRRIRGIDDKALGTGEGSGHGARGTG